MTTDDHLYPSGTFSQTFQRFASQVFSLNDKDAVENPANFIPLARVPFDEILNHESGLAKVLGPILAMQIAKRTY